MKKIGSLLLAALFIVMTMTACGSSAPASSAPASSSEAASSTAPAASSESDDGLTVAGKLVVGLDDQFPPMGFRNEKNEIVGFDVDLAKAVGEKLGLEVVLTPIDWSTKELELNGDKVDLLWNGLTITDARKESMLLSGAYVKNAQVAVVGVDSGLTALADLAGKVVALQDGSSADEAWAACAVAGSEKDLVKAAENVTLFTDLKMGRIDAVIVDKVVADYYIANSGEGKLKVLEDQLADEEYGIAFKKGNTVLADKVLGALDEMCKDGSAAEISKKWFGEDRVVFAGK